MPLQWPPWPWPCPSPCLLLLTPTTLLKVLLQLWWDKMMFQLACSWSPCFSWFQWFRPYPCFSNRLEEKENNSIVICFDCRMHFDVRNIKMREDVCLRTKEIEFATLHSLSVLGVFCFLSRIIWGISRYCSSHL